MRRTVAEIQKCKPGLCLPETAETTLTVFTVVDQLQSLLLELEKVCQTRSLRPLAPGSCRTVLDETVCFALHL